MIFWMCWHVEHLLQFLSYSDTMVRQAAMAMKCLLLIYYKNGRGHNFRRQVQWFPGSLNCFQIKCGTANIAFILSEFSDCLHLVLKGQILTLVEYALLLYRALLPTPVWYRFFLNKDYGSLFSSLTTGLYLTFKLTTVVDKVQFHQGL